MARHTTIADIAREAGVSVGTASNVLNSKGRHSDTTRARVLGAAEALHYVPNALIRSLQSGRTNTVGVFTWRFLSEVSDDASLDLLKGIAEGIWSAGYDALLYRRHPHEGAVLPAMFLDGRVDCVILVPGGISRAGFEALRASGLPAVSLYEADVPDDVPSILIDNRAGVRAAMRHLAALGHRRIGFCAPEYTYDFRERLAGYREGLEEHGIDPDPLLVAHHRLLTREEVAGALARSIGRGRATAVVCGFDRIALLACEVLREWGLRVPQDVSVVGFDDAPAARGARLTTIRQPAEAVGRAAARCAARCIAPEGNAERCREVFDVELVIRGTTAPAPDAPPAIPPHVAAQT